MKDQDQTPVSQSQLPSKKPNLFYDWWEEMYPRDFLLTFKNYFFNHKKFFDEVFNEQWEDKVKPMAFLFTSIGIALIIGSISPWGLSFKPEPPQPKAWGEMRKIMNSEDSDKFIDIFGLYELDTIQDTTKYFKAVDNKIVKVIGTTPPSAKNLQSYFEKKAKENNNLESENYKLLAARAEYVDLKQQVEHEKTVKNEEISEVEQIIIINIFVFYSMFFWLVAHKFFKKANRSTRETVFVFMYGLGMLIFFVYVPFIAIAGVTDDNLLSYSFLVVLVLFLFMLYKIFSIFKYTHNTGFFSLMIVYIKTFLVSILFGIPLLFMSRKKENIVSK